ncbi:hypothetical protein [Romboutsia sp.]|uniref:hypothetical protein n=1 Tax=Romboutsia sp. TaxID=1965302 RepID=UPI003F6711E5
MINNEKFYDNYFKFLVLLFWPMIWYKKVAVSSHSLELFMVSIFSILATVYIILFSIFYNNNSKIKRIVILYRVTLLLSFIFTLFSFLIFTTSIFWLFLKMIFVLLLFYISSIQVFKYKIEEGLVGILSSLLLLAITLLY